jgi:hypothetical protein
VEEEVAWIECARAHVQICKRYARELPRNLQSHLRKRVHAFAIVPAGRQCVQGFLCEN